MLFCHRHWNWSILGVVLWAVATHRSSYYKVWAEEHRRRRSPNYFVDTACSHCSRCCNCGCDCPGNHVALLLEVLRRLGTGLQCLADLDELFPACSYYSQDMLHSWRSSIEENIRPFNALPMQSVDSDSATQRYVAVVFSSQNFSYNPLSSKESHYIFDRNFKRTRLWAL